MERANTPIQPTNSQDNTQIPPTKCVLQAGGLCPLVSYQDALSPQENKPYTVLCLFLFLVLWPQV